MASYVIVSLSILVGLVSAQGPFGKKAFATEINCRSTLRITHVVTGAHLHSHPYNYGHFGTSCQQQITAYQGTDYNDLWIVRSPCTSPVRNGEIIRLEHAATKRYLHSHPNIPAPVTRSQQEVTGYGGGDTSDRNDLSVTKICGRRLNYAASSNPWASTISGTGVDVPYTR